MVPPATTPPTQTTLSHGVGETQVFPKRRGAAAIMIGLAAVVVTVIVIAAVTRMGIPAIGAGSLALASVRIHDVVRADHDRDIRRRERRG